jgi:hypothetical protein
MFLAVNCNVAHIVVFPGMQKLFNQFPGNTAFFPGLSQLFGSTFENSSVIFS